MTDRIDTPADLVATLATISESLSATAMPTLDNIEAQLLPLLDDAEARNDQQAITLIRGTYARAQELINVAQASRENAATAVDLAQNFRNQRDDIAKELDELNEDAENVNLDNPLVKHIHNTGIDDAFVNYEGFHYDCPGCAAYDNGHLPEIDHDAVNIIIAAMMGSFGELSEKRTRQLTRLVNTFGDLMYADNHKDSPFAPNNEDVEGGDDDE